jgi:hypothetical protein
MNNNLGLCMTVLTCDSIDHHDFLNDEGNFRLTWWKLAAKELHSPIQTIWSTADNDSKPLQTLWQLFPNPLRVIVSALQPSHGISSALQTVGQKPPPVGPTSNTGPEWTPLFTTIFINTRCVVTSFYQRYGVAPNTSSICAPQQFPLVCQWYAHLCLVLVVLDIILLVRRSVEEVITTMVNNGNIVATLLLAIYAIARNRFWVSRNWQLVL